MDEWHRIEEGLPAATEKVLGWSVDEGEVRIVWRGEDNPDGTRPWRIDDDSGCATMTVSHWIPLPAPPAVEPPDLGVNRVAAIIGSIELTEADFHRLPHGTTHLSLEIDADGAEHITHSTDGGSTYRRLYRRAD